MGAQRARSGSRWRSAPVLGLLAATTLLLTLVLPALAGRGSGPRAARDAEASDAAATIVSLINGARSAHGLEALAVAGDLTAAAADRAAAMAASGALSHTPNLGDKVCCWTWIGENVGYAYSAKQAHDMFMGSAPHRANILEARADDVGVAVVTKGGTLWVAEVFRGRSGSSAGSGSGASTGGTRDRAAVQPSRSGSRSAPATDGAGRVTTAPTRSPHSATWVLTQRLHDLRLGLQQRVRVHGRLDPVMAAVAYVRVLDRVNR